MSRISGDSQAVPVTPQDDDSPDDGKPSSDSGISSDTSYRAPSRLRHLTTSKPLPQTRRSVAPARGGRGVCSKETSAQGRSHRQEDSVSGSKPALRRKRQPASSDRTPTGSDLLRPGTGHAGRNGRWPPKAAYTLRGRTQEIVCDTCKGRVHWCCAGLAEDATPPVSEWDCPDCAAKLERGESRRHGKGRSLMLRYTSRKHCEGSSRYLYQR
jgi:hypothetical protein